MCNTFSSTASMYTFLWDESIVYIHEQNDSCSLISTWLRTGELLLMSERLNASLLSSVTNELLPELESTNDRARKESLIERKIFGEIHSAYRSGSFQTSPCSQSTAIVEHDQWRSKTSTASLRSKSKGERKSLSIVIRLLKKFHRWRKSNVDRRRYSVCFVHAALDMGDFQQGRKWIREAKQMLITLRTALQWRIISFHR